MGGPRTMKQIDWRVLLALTALLAAGSARADDAVQPNSWSAIANLPTLLDYPGGLKDTLRSVGLNADFWISQFYQGLSSGPGPHNGLYAGKGDLFVTADGQKLGLWPGLSATLHLEGVWGESPNFTGGLLLPVNTAWAWPTAADFTTDASLIVTQKFTDNLSVTVGKFNMLDQATKTPIHGGGGYVNFMNIMPTAPVTGIIPPYLYGANLSTKTAPAIFNLFVYDPRNAQDPHVLPTLFTDGYVVNGAVTIPISIGGLAGYQGVKAVYSTQKQIDLADIPQLALPPGSSAHLDVKDNKWFIAYTFEQYLFRSPNNPKDGIGIFGEYSVSDGNPNPLRNTWFFGVAGTSFLPSRPLDRWGVAYFHDHVSPTLIQGLAALNIPLGDEAGVEAFYNIALAPWFTITPDIQIIAPGEVPGRRDVILGVRSVAKF
jgi:porin